MPRSLLIGCLFVFAESVAVADGPPAADALATVSAAESGRLVAIETVGGRRLVGKLEPHSDTRTVFLRSERPGIVLTTRVPAGTIRRIGHHDGSNVLRLDGAAPAVAASQPAAASGRVQTLRVDAWPANWDRDGDLDGLRLHVTPLSAHGIPVTARGTLNVRLTARRFSSVRSDDTVTVVEQWSRQLTPSDFGPEGAIVDLPFEKLHPERDVDVIPVGLLQADLGISGQGTFSAPAVEFWLRPNSYIRDELQLHTGSREFQRRDLPPRIPGR